MEGAMRYGVIGAGVILAMAAIGSAAAQAPPPGAPPPPPPGPPPPVMVPGAVDWTGPHVGINLGGVWGRLPSSVTLGATPGGPVGGVVLPATAASTVNLRGNGS